MEELKKEQLTLHQELEKAKAKPIVRQQDESTRFFNLRQHQIELKIKELEDKKEKSEKELQAILQLKNSRLHDDLKKLAQFILQESRKIAPLEKELLTYVWKNPALEILVSAGSQITSLTLRS